MKNKEDSKFPLWCDMKRFLNKNYRPITDDAAGMLGHVTSYPSVVSIFAMLKLDAVNDSVEHTLC